MKISLKKVIVTWGIVFGILSQCVPVTRIYAAQNTYEVCDSVQQKIDKALSINGNNKEYIDEIIERFYQDIHTDEEGFNEYLDMALDSILDMEDTKNEKYLIALRDYIEKNREQQNSQVLNANSRITGYPAAVGAYKLGIAIVRNRGCKYTANYMEHALEFSGNNSPSTYVHHNDDWARELSCNFYLGCQIAMQFEEEVIGQDKAYGEVHGSFAFTSDNSSLDAFAALHNVDYSVIFTRKGDGTYSALYKLSDVYDFDWSGYDNFEIGFANNYCYMMQEMNWIKPFPIDIFYSV